MTTMIDTRGLFYPLPITLVSRKLRFIVNLISSWASNMSPSHYNMDARMNESMT